MSAPTNPAIGLTGPTGGYVHVSEKPPIDPAPNDLWFCTSGSIGLYVRYNNGISEQWVELTRGLLS